MKSFRLWRAALLAVLVLGLSLASVPARAAAPTRAKGLQISPIRQEISVNPGALSRNDFVVANLTKQPLEVAFYVEEFSITDTNYDYSFDLSRYDWIRLSDTDITLQPQESRTISYTLNPPSTASPGGYYFTILASSNIRSGGVNSTIQAASLLYTTVNGNLDKSTRLDNVSVPSLVFSPDITYSFDLTDTGNTHYVIYSIAKLDGMLSTTSALQAAHIVLPGKPRHLTGSLPAPLLPGLYTATIGYRTDSGNVLTRSSTVIYLPLWSIVVLIGLAYIAYRVIRIIRRHRAAKAKQLTD